jgi:cyclase
VINEVADGIFTVDHRVADGKNVVILGERGAWAVDTGSDAEEGERIAALIRAHGYRPERLIYTHGHGDHILGSTAFQGCEVFAHALTPIEIERLLPTLAHRAGCSPATLRRQIVWPTVTFRDELFVNLGNRRLHLFPTPGHSQDGISIYLPEERLLIAGDSVVTGIVPAIGDGDSVVLEASLRKLAQLPIDLLVPGHGAVVEGRDEVADWLQWLPDYLQRVRHFVRTALAAGIAPAAIAGRCAFDEFIGTRLPKAQHKMVKRHAATVEKIVRECTAASK